jgi:hypothetical protein
MLLKDRPSGMKFVLVEDDWSRGRENDRFVASEESRLASNAYLTHELVLDTSTVFKRESRGNGLGYPNVERNVLAVEHAILLARPPKINGALANKVIVRVWRNTWNGLDLSKFHADILSLNALRTQANLDCPFNSSLRPVRCAWRNARISLDKIDVWRRAKC